MSSGADIHERFIATETAIGLLLRRLGQQAGIDVERVLSDAREDALAITDGDFSSRVVYVLDRITEEVER